VNLERAQVLFYELAKLEERTFIERRKREESRRQAAKRRKLQNKTIPIVKSTDLPSTDEQPIFPANELNPRANAIRHVLPKSFDNQTAALRLKEALQSTDGSPKVGEKRKHPEESNEEMTSAVESDSEPEDNVRLWEPGYKERYYRQKFGVELEDTEFRRQVVFKYVEGLCWVLRYYYQGCPSWKWYYPYHYAPFASDFVDIDQFEIKFEKGTPFKPVEQLMGVLPAASRKHIPSVFHSLMTDPNSEIIDFYPTEFDLDMNGKKFAWQAVALLPFIDEARLLKAMAPFYDKLTEEEKQLNTLGKDVLYVSKRNKLYQQLASLYAKQNDEVSKRILFDAYRLTYILASTIRYKTKYAIEWYGDA
jgi:5'-3' exoribonuclease 2